MKQEEQDRLWDRVQAHRPGVFDLSYPRLRFLAERCAPGAAVLNIGVGTGYLEELLVQRRVAVHAVDPSAESIARLQARLGLGDRARQGHGQRLPFESERFDTVIMSEVLEHLETEVLHQTLDEVRRVLKPGGEFTGTVPYQEDLDASVVVCPTCESQFHRWGHAQRFDRAGLSRLLEQHGFRLQRMYPRTFPDFRRPGPTAMAKALFRYVLGRLGEPLVWPSLYFRARRPVNSR